MAMQLDLESEKRSMARIWSKREKQIRRAMENTAGFYGDLQGIVGASIPVIPGLAIAPENPESSETADLDFGEGANDA